MKHSDVVFDFLVPANENAPKPIHPTVRPFYHPAARFGAGISFEFLGFLAASANVSRETKLLNDFSNLIKVITFIHAHALLFSRCRLRGLDRHALDGGLDHFHIVAVGAVHGHAHRNPFGLDQQAAFDALLGAIGGVFPGLFPPRGELWSCSRPCSTTTSRCLGVHRRPANWPSTWSERRRLGAILGNGRAPWSPDKSGWHRGPSIGNRCEAQTKWLPCTRGQVFAVGHRQSGVCFC